MSAGLRALLTGVIDYAGLFPPARLPLDQAIRNCARYRTEPDAWMLGRFICPAARLAELDSFAEELFQTGPPFAFSALGRGGETAAEFLKALDADLAAIACFRKRHAGRVVVDAFEVRLPREKLEAEAVAAALTSLGPPTVTPHFETQVGADWRSTIASGVNFAALRRPWGFKLRCGGTEPSAFPPPEQVAFTIYCCGDVGVPLKLTAGLHHPVRHFSTGESTRMHGFLNVFVAGVLAHARQVTSQEQVRRIIEDEDSGHFAFDEGGLRWQGLRATVREIASARQSGVTSFGSCSFDEPREDLRALGLLK